VSQTNDSITTISFNNKKFSYGKQEISELLSHGKIQLSNPRLKLLANLMCEIFPEFVFIDGDVMLVNKEFNFDSYYHTFKERIKQKYLEKYRCKRHPSVMLNKEFRCRRYTTCIILNNGQKPKDCIAIGGTAEILLFNNNELDVPKLNFEQIDDNLKPYYERLIVKMVSTLQVEKKSETNNIEIDSKTVNVNINYTEIKKEIIINEEDDDTLKEIKKLNIEVYNQISSTIDKTIRQLLTNNFCPLIVLDSYERQTGSMGKCRILSKFAKPIKVNARQPYIFMPKRNVCCYEQYRFPNYYFCWVYKEYYKRKDDSDVEVEILE
jgi:hypothetical protein